MADQNEFSLLNFPDKLWYMVNEPKCEQIQWNDDGTTVIIPDNNDFVSKVLNNPSRILFKTKNFSSFVRQLNLYGFRKVSEHRKVGQSQSTANNRSEFRHPCFIKERKDLLGDVKRQPSSTRREQCPSEEKPQSFNSNQVQGRYIASPSTVGGFWSNWDPYLCPIPWMPYGGANGGYPVPSTSPYYLPPHPTFTNPAQPSFELRSMFNDNHVDGMANDYMLSQTYPACTAANPYTRDVKAVNHFQNEAKKPLPAQTGNVSTTCHINVKTISGQSTAEISTTCRGNAEVLVSQSPGRNGTTCHVNDKALTGQSPAAKIITGCQGDKSAIEPCANPEIQKEKRLKSFDDFIDIQDFKRVKFMKTSDD